MIGTGRALERYGARVYANAHGVQLDVLPQIGSFFDRAIEAGHGSDDVGVVATV